MSKPSKNTSEKTSSQQLTVTDANPKSIIESYIFATAHQNISIYSERLLMILVRAAQCQISGLNFCDSSAIKQIEVGPLGEVQVEIETRELLGGPNDTNYSQAKNAVLELTKKAISHERPLMKNGKPVLNSAGKPVYEFEAHALLNDVYINRKPGTIQVNVNKTTWEAILDFSKGFRKYDLQIAMRFSHSCTLRIFKIISNQKSPLQFTIQELRERWGLTETYKKNSDFIKNTIKVAKRELDSMSPWTFDYELISDTSSGRVGRRTSSSIIFFPVHQVQFDRDAARRSQTASVTDIIDRETYDRLKGVGFTQKEIIANATLFRAAQRHLDLSRFIESVRPYANRANNPQGYIINSLKNHLTKECGVTIDRNGNIISPRPESNQETLERERRERAESLFPFDEPEDVESEVRTSDDKRSALADILGGALNKQK